MSKLTWSAQDANYSYGVSQGVLYLDGVSVPWNGLISVEEVDNSSLDTSLYFDGKKHRLPQEPGNFTAKITAFTYPEEFEPYDGLDSLATGQNRSRFALSYRVETGQGYQIHLVYNALVYPTTKARISVREESESVSEFTWDLVTTGIDTTWTKHAAHFIIDSTLAHPTPLVQLEARLYGTPSLNPDLPSPAEIIDLFEDYTAGRIVYNGDGTFTIYAPDDMLTIDGDVFTFNSPRAFYVLNEGTYLMRSNWEG